MKSINGLFQEHIEKVFIQIEEYFYKLYKAIDDIDTTSDIYKGNYKARCKHIDEIIAEAKKVLPGKFVVEMYNKYYNRDEDILRPYFKPLFEEEVKEDKPKEFEAYVKDVEKRVKRKVK